MQVQNDIANAALMQSQTSTHLHLLSGDFSHYLSV